MNIWLQGPSGAGKTTVGKLLAEQLGRPFVDIDEKVVMSHGTSIADIFWNEGESAFRRLEWDALLDQIENGDADAVVSLGGGAVADSAVRTLIRSRGLRVFMDVDSTTAMNRLQEGESRPLLFEEDPEAAWQKLYRKRLRYYRETDITVDAATVPEQVIAELVQQIEHSMQPAWSISRTLGSEMSTVSCYSSLFVLFSTLTATIENRRHCIITDRSIVQSYEDFIFDPAAGDRKVLTLDCGEDQKSLATVEQCARELARDGFTRDGIIIAIGGGVVTDVAGFLASVYMRGVEVNYVPTTLLAQVDAAIGGKTAVNASGIRNLLGTIRQPAKVLICPAFLHTLTHREMKSGFVEAVKMGIANSAVLDTAVRQAMPELLDGEVPSTIEDVIRLSIETKLDVVERDTYDQSLRFSLNFGHTFGHALESVAPGEYAHGEAVAFGMIAASELAAMLELISSERRDAVIAQSLPFTHIADHPQSIDSIVHAMASDKKRTSSSLQLVLPTEETGVQIHATTDMTLVQQAVTSAMKRIETFQESV